MKEYNRICARVDLDAVEYNIERMKQNISSDASMLAVVKMDGYGHGAVQIAQMLEEYPLSKANGLPASSTS